MKLSLTRKRGHVFVRGGQIVKVVKTHAVSTKTRSTIEADRAPVDDIETVFAELGDLAIEILSARTGDKIGYSYLSGHAIRCNHYDAEDHWFAPGTKQRVTIPEPQHFTERNKWIEMLVATMMTIKYGTIDVGAFEIRLRKDEYVHWAAEHIAQAWSYQLTPEDGDAHLDELRERLGHDPDDPIMIHGHLLGLIRGKRKAIHMHFQPPHHASDWAASMFQAGLVLKSFKEKKPDTRRRKRKRPRRTRRK